MSIVSEIIRIQDSVYESYMAAADKGAEWPTDDGSFPVDRLPDMIRTIPAVDVPDIWHVSVRANDPSLGVALGNGVVSVGLMAQVTVHALMMDPEARFVGWALDGVIVSTDWDYSFYVMSDVSLVAVFEKARSASTSDA